MFWKKNNKERIIELEAKIDAWKETWGSVKGDIPLYVIKRVEKYIAELYKLRKMEKL